MFRPLLLIVLIAVTSPSCIAVRGDQEVSFSRDVLPVLSDRCFHCHGPDDSHREADLRLDVRESTIADRGGYTVITPTDAAASELVARITSRDPDVQMPPPESHRKPLTEQEISIVTRWINEGAPWGRHWSFEKPRRPPVKNPSLHPVDELIRRHLAPLNLQPAPEAAPHTLARRLAFDLTGLPPTHEQSNALAVDHSPPAYEDLVDQLLASPHYGERMAMWWLDAARYADTDGYQQDATRNNWPWRDWVVAAFNDNMPFDQFTIEQFAGDLLPDATQEQILATCFHRNHMTNGEGGRDPEESRIDYVIDRVNTTGTVWLGLTLGCSQCHSHKFDPISQHDYYSLFAFFDNIDEDGKAGSAAKPYLKTKSPFAEAALTEAQAVVDARQPVVDAVKQRAEIEFEDWLIRQIADVQQGFQPWHVLSTTDIDSVEGTVLTRDSNGIIQTSGPNPRQDDYRISGQTRLPRVTGLRLEVFPHDTHTGGQLSRGSTGLFILTDVKLQVRRHGHAEMRDIEIASAVADVERDVKGRNYGKINDTLDDDPRNGWTTEPDVAGESHVAVFALAEPLLLADDEELIFVMLHRSTEGNANIGRFRVSVTDQPGAAVRSLNAMPMQQLQAAAVSGPSDLDEGLRGRLFEQFLADHQHYLTVLASLEQAKSQRDEVQRATRELNVMVLQERQTPRSTYVLERGVWDAKGEQVERGVPSSILDWPSEKTQTRLDLARWLVDRDNPLTARVVVNHLWQLCFGAGLVRTPEDFGRQGEFPTHPELLDWLAVEFMEHDWDVKHILRVIVTSAAYRQSSVVTPLQHSRDPQNLLLARGARFRLPSWMIRDAALHSSGLLNDAIGGPPVRPYQPDGVWEEIFMGRFNYEPSQGPAQHRRSLYAFWRRSAAPTFLFDSAQRRSCEVRSHPTNTPLHALTLLNDLSILEASRELAKSALSHSAESRQRLDIMWRTVLSRPPSDEEFNVLRDQLSRALSHYTRAPAAAEELLEFGQPERRPNSHQTETAAYTLVASMIYNLDEAMTHE